MHFTLFKKNYVYVLGSFSKNKNYSA